MRWSPIGGGPAGVQMRERPGALPKPNPAQKSSAAADSRLDGRKLDVDRVPTGARTIRTRAAASGQIRARTL